MRWFEVEIWVEKEVSQFSASGNEGEERMDAFRGQLLVWERSQRNEEMGKGGRGERERGGGWEGVLKEVGERERQSATTP